MQKCSSELYIGCTVTLVSKANIRYTGTLYVLDPSQHTISLADVRALGTEGRCGKPVPPDKQVYEYIIFRRGDVHDVRVLGQDDKPSATHANKHGWKRVARF